MTEAQRLLAAAGYDVHRPERPTPDTLKLLFDPEAEATLRTLRRAAGATAYASCKAG